MSEAMPRGVSDFSRQNGRWYARWMVSNAGFWAHYFREYHVPVIEAFQVAVEKLSTAFSGMNVEVDARVEADYERISATSGEDKIDLGDVRELANERALACYETMAGVQQGVLNLLAVGLHHLLEQQQLFFLRRELARGEEPSRLKATRLEQQLKRQGIDCRQFRCADRLYELRKAANAIKHGAGSSAKELAGLRPDLFEYTALDGDSAAEVRVSARSSAELVSWLFTPLAGDRLYVSERDLSDWCVAAIEYWEELSTKLDEQQLRQADG